MFKTKVVPDRKELLRLLGANDFFVWEYYGRGLLGKLHSYVFRSRYKTLLKSLGKQDKLGLVIDIGCGPMFLAYPLGKFLGAEYVGLDLLNRELMHKYKEAMKSLGVESLGVVRGSAEVLPFRNQIFKCAFALDVLEHLRKPKDAIKEVNRVVERKGLVAISLPLESMVQKLARFGFVLMGKKRPVLSLKEDPDGKKGLVVGRKVEFHYVGDLSCYDEMRSAIKQLFQEFHVKYTPLGFVKALNINAVHIFKTKSK